MYFEGGGGYITIQSTLQIRIDIRLQTPTHVQLHPAARGSCAKVWQVVGQSFATAETTVILKSVLPTAATDAPLRNSCRCDQKAGSAAVFGQAYCLECTLTTNQQKTIKKADFLEPKVRSFHTKRYGGNKRHLDWFGLWFFAW